MLSDIHVDWLVRVIVFLVVVVVIVVIMYKAMLNQSINHVDICDFVQF